MSASSLSEHRPGQASRQLRIRPHIPGCLVPLPSLTTHHPLLSQSCETPLYIQSLQSTFELPACSGWCAICLKTLSASFHLPHLCRPISSLLTCHLPPEALPPPQTEWGVPSCVRSPVQRCMCILQQSESTRSNHEFLCYLFSQRNHPSSGAPSLTKALLRYFSCSHLSPRWFCQPVVAFSLLFSSRHRGSERLSTLSEITQPISGDGMLSLILKPKLQARCEKDRVSSVTQWRWSNSRQKKKKKKSNISVSLPWFWYIDDVHYAFLKITPSQTPSCNWSGATEVKITQWVGPTMSSSFPSPCQMYRAPTVCWVLPAAHNLCQMGMGT